MTGAKIVTTAEKYLDKCGSKFCKDYGLNYIVEWCCIYVWDIFRMAGASDLCFGGRKICNCGVADEWLREHATYIKDISKAKAGDIIIMTWSSSGGHNKRQGSRQHIGIVIRSNGSKSVDTIEGNTGSASCNKSKVHYRTRELKYIYAIYRPKYAADKKQPDLTALIKNTLSGKYGTGDERKKALGDNYAAVQKEVTRISKLTNDALSGKYGTGEDRKKALGKDYSLVQWNINRIEKEKK